MRLFIILSNFLYFSLSFTLNTPVNIYKKVYNDQIIKVYEPNNIDKKNMDAIIFYTGANSLIPADIYSSFIIALNNYNFSVNVVTNDDTATKELLYEARNDYKSIIPLTHSSGYVSAINTINSQKNIKKAIFLDPVDNNNLINFSPFNFNPFNFNKNINTNTNKYNYLQKILILNAEKSYKWSLFPKFEIPFIPGFALDTKKIQNINSDLILEKINSENYGHSDILDSLWSDLMHVTLSKGHDDRSNENFVEYHNWLSEQIYYFVNEHVYDIEKEEQEEKITETQIIVSPSSNSD